MAFRFGSLIVVACLLGLAQLLVPSSKAMAADALFGQPRITAAINDTNLFRITGVRLSAEGGVDRLFVAKG